MTTCLPQIVRGNSACLISISHAAAYQAFSGKDWAMAVLSNSGCRMYTIHPDLAQYITDMYTGLVAMRAAAQHERCGPRSAYFAWGCFHDFCPGRAVPRRRDAMPGPGHEIVRASRL